MKPTLRKKHDFLELKANLKNYSFQQKTGYKRMGSSYYFWTKQYDCTFQISANHIDYFFQKDFEQKFFPNKEFKFTMPKHNQGGLTDKKVKILIFSLEDESQTYLNENLTISDANDHFESKLGVFLIVLGIGIHYFKNRKKINK